MFAFLSPLRDLFTDDASGKLSHTKVWSNAGSAAATISFAKLAWLGTASDSLWLIFLGGMCGHAVYSQIVSHKFAGTAAAADDGEAK